MSRLRDPAQRDGAQAVQAVVDAIRAASVERSTYVLFSSLALVLLFWQWRPMPAVVWQIADPPIAMAVTGLSFAGWLIVLTSTFLINHFELFGLQQVANNLAGRPTPAPRFRTPLHYQFVRHPIYLGFIIAFWAAPTMTVGPSAVRGGDYCLHRRRHPVGRARSGRPIRRRLPPLQGACVDAGALAEVGLIDHYGINRTAHRHCRWAARCVDAPAPQCTGGTGPSQASPRRFASLTSAAVSGPIGSRCG